MPGQNSIAIIINNALKAGNFKTKRFQSGSYNGIAEPIKTIEKDEKEITAPYIIDLEGEGQTLVYNDTGPFTIFHRAENPSYVIPTDDYGRPGTTMQETTNMRMVFAGSRSRMQARPENVIAAAVMDFPKELDPSVISSLGINSCVIEMGVVNNDPYSVWSQEWQGMEYDLSTNTIMFSIAYTLIITYNKGTLTNPCFNLCEQGNE